MNINAFFTNLVGLNLVGIIFKILAVLFSVGYFIYAFVYSQQVKKMTHTFISKHNFIVTALSFLQLAIGLFLIIYSLTFL